MLDEELRVISASSSFYRVFAVEPEADVGDTFTTVADHLDVPALREFLARFLPTAPTSRMHEIEIDLPELGTARAAR